jgi:hypothetical protein
MGCGGRRPVAECRVWSLRVVFHAPFFNHDLRLLQRVKNLSVQVFIAQPPVEAFAVAVLPRTSRLDVQASPYQPLPATALTPSLRTPDHCPNECVPGFPGTASHLPELRSPHASRAFSLHGWPDSLVCIRRSASTCAAFCHHEASSTDCRLQNRTAIRRATLYDGFGSVKGHLGFTSREGSFSLHL